MKTNTSSAPQTDTHKVDTHIEAKPLQSATPEQAAAVAEQSSGRNNGKVQTGHKISATGVSTMQTNWVAGTAICAVGNGVTGYGYMEEGETGKGFLTMFGGHLGESICELAEGDSFGDVAGRRVSMN